MAQMTYAIAVKLIEQGIEQGAARIKSSLYGIQMQAIAMAGALAGGVSGLQDLISKLVDVARETNRVQTALKNVSNGVVGFSKNMQFLRDLSQQYGLDVNDTTSSFAKFTASATQAGMSLKDQQQVFTSLSRSVAAFGLSGEEAKGVMFALSQMMSKGTIKAEELNNQMAERLPIAITAMARAAGGSVSEMSDKMKKGLLRSSEILPKFAEELDKMTLNVDTDNAETSVNRLKNSFAALAEDWDIVGKFKVVVDQIRSLLDSLRSSVSGIAGVIGGIVGGKIAKGVYTAYINQINAIKAQAEAERKAIESQQANEAKAAERITRAESSHQTTLKSIGDKEAQAKAQAESLVRAELDKQAVIEARLLSLEEARLKVSQSQAQAIAKAKDTSKAAYQNYRSNLGTGERGQSYDRWVQSQERQLRRLEEERIASERRYDAERTRLESQRVAQSNRVAQAEMRGAEMSRRATETADRAREASARRLESVRISSAQAVAQAEVQTTTGATSRIGTLSSAMSGRLVMAGQAVRNMFVSVGVAIKGMMASFAPMLIIGGIVSIITKVSELADKWDEATQAQNRYQDAANKAVRSDNEVQTLERLLGVLQSAKSTSEERMVAEQRLSQQLGFQGVESSKLVQLGKQRLKVKRQEVELEYARGEKSKTEEEVRGIQAERKRGGYAPLSKEQTITSAKVNAVMDEHALGKYVLNPLARLGSAIEGVFGRSDHDDAVTLGGHNQYIDKLSTQIGSLNKTLSKDIVEYDKMTAGLSEIPAPVEQTAQKKQKTKKHQESPLERAEREWDEGKKALRNSLLATTISTDEYNASLNDLADKTRKAIGEILGARSMENKSFREANTNYKPKQEESEGRKVLNEYYESVNKLHLQLRRGIISNEEYENSLRGIRLEAAKKLGGVEKLSLGEHAEAGFITAGLMSNNKKPQRKQRDTTYDYKASEADKLRGEKDVLDEYIRQLQEGNDIYKNWNKEIDKLLQQSKNLDDAIKVANIKEDVKKLSQEFSSGVFGSVREVSGAIRNVNNGITNMIQTLKSSDASGLEKILSVLDGMASTADGIMSIISLIEKLTTASQALAIAKTALSSATKAESAADTISTGVKVANATARSTADVAESTVKAGTASANITANTAEAASEAGKSAAKLPFPLNLIAIGAAIAGAIALFKAIPKFANGGIVPGTSKSGDRVLAGVNSGELILNEAQQGNIASKLRQGGGAVSVDVHIKERLRGKDLRRSVSRATRSYDR